MFKKDFPSLVDNKVAYLDSAASAQKPEAVIEKMNNVLRTGYANIHRGLYDWSQDITRGYEDTRSLVGQFIGVDNKDEIVFTRNSTEAINLVAQSWGRTYLKAGDEIIISSMEHHANIIPWHLLRDAIGIVIKVIPLLPDSSLDINAYREMLSPKTKLVSVVHVSNAIGVINDVAKITEIAKSYEGSDITVMIDGSQSIVHKLIHIPDINCDFFVFTGHKLYAPTGIGVLWGKEDILNSMPPYQGGGDMIDMVTFQESSYRKTPVRFEAGTPPIVEVIGLGEAIKYINNIGMDKIIEYEDKLTEYANEELSKVLGLRILGQEANKIGVFSLILDGVHTSDVAMILDQMGIAVRTGHHCCMPLMDALGVEGTIRASIGMYNDRSDVDRLVAGLNKAREMLL